MLRKVTSIITGYAIFVATLLVFFKLSGQNPHSDASLNFMVITAIYGVISSLVSGLVTKLISGTKNLKINYILSLIIAGFATFSFFKAEGNHWTQILTIFIFASASILGGLFWNK